MYTYIKHIVDEETAVLNESLKVNSGTFPVSLPVSWAFSFFLHMHQCIPNEFGTTNIVRIWNHSNTGMKMHDNRFIFLTMSYSNNNSLLILCSIFGTMYNGNMPKEFKVDDTIWKFSDINDMVASLRIYYGYHYTISGQVHIIPESEVSHSTNFSLNHFQT